jgi:hypothetical protein
LSGEALALRYTVAGTSALASPPNAAGTVTQAPTPWTAAPFHLVGGPTLAAAFVEHRWGPEDSTWQLTTGLRGTELTGWAPRLEPRASAELRVASGVMLTAGFARTHQYVQSLRNADSPYGAQLGIDLPVAAGMGGLPIAQGDAGTLGIVTRLAPGVRLTVDGYLRHLSGLAVVGPLRPEAFAVRDFDRASAHVAGLSAELDGTVQRFSWTAAYGLGATTERLGWYRYHPTAQAGQTAQLAVGARLGAATQIRVANWGTFGQPAPGVGASPMGRDDDVPGIQEGPNARGESAWITAGRLPPYLRTDISLVHDWRLGPAGGRLSTFMTLANAFNHANVAAYLPRGAGLPTLPVTLVPRSLVGGVSWGF